MGIRTRSATSSPTKKATAAPAATDDEQHQQLKVIVGPRSISSDSRFLLLKHPRDDVVKQFLFCPQAGLHELTKLSTTSFDPRSVLFTIPTDDSEQKGMDLIDTASDISRGYINKDAEIFTITPFDIAFLLIRIMAPSNISSKKSMFQPLDDLLDIPGTEDRNFRYILEKGRVPVERAMSSICDTVEAGDETLFRYSEDKVLQLMLAKANRVVDQGLPASLEERFVTRALEAPVLSVRREETTVVSVTQPNPAGGSNTSSDSFESQSTTISSTESAVFSQVSTTSTDLSAVEESETSDMRRLLRTRTVFSFITASYLPTLQAERLRQKLTLTGSPINFQPLDEHLKHLVSLRAEALASRSMSDYSRKRGHVDDDEAVDAKAEKKRKQEEDEKKRKANESRGVRDLKKVNVSGMKKMSDFFGKKPLVKAKT